MFRTIIGALAILLLLTGCATTIMEHPYRTSIDKDLYECQQIGERRARTWGGDLPNPILYKQYTRECLEYRGWEKVKT